MKRAYFVYRPRWLPDLMEIHVMSQELPYDVVAEKVLSAMKYENFITDLLADRQFIEEVASAEGEVMQCLLVRAKGREDGVLVVADAPNRPAFVRRRPTDGH